MLSLYSPSVSIMDGCDIWSRKGDHKMWVIFQPQGAVRVNIMWTWSPCLITGLLHLSQILCLKSNLKIKQIKTISFTISVLKETVVFLITSQQHQPNVSDWCLVIFQKHFVHSIWEQNFTTKFLNKTVIPRSDSWTFHFCIKCL